MSLIDRILSETPAPHNLREYRILIDPEGSWSVFESPSGNSTSNENISVLLDQLTKIIALDTEWRILQQIKIHYPVDLPFISPETGFDKRPSGTKRYQGVYFAQHPDKLNLLKIGCSVDVYKRMLSLAHEYGGKPLTVVGFVETTHQYVVEKYLHRFYKDYRADGEWFQEATALSWLRGMAK